MSQMPFGSYGFSAGSTLGYRSREEELSVGQFFNMVYAWMCVGLATTAAVAYCVATFFPQLMTSGVGWIALIAQLVLVVTISNAVKRVSTPLATALFVLYSALVGVTFSVLFYVYSHVTLGVVFAETAGVFGAMSLYGFVTKRDLTRLGSFLFMALIGLIIAMVVNFFVHSSAMQYIISCVGILLFVGLTAFDTQRLKMIALQTGSNPTVAGRLAIVGSLTLYLDFINLFIFMLQVLGGGNRRN
jgi:FtsH-binding integral membrane protein